MNDHIEGHTVKRYDEELQALWDLSHDLGGLALRQFGQSLAALTGLDEALARQVIALDQTFEHMVRRTNGAIAELVARRSPMGGDLKLVITVWKSVAELERIGGEAVRIAHLAVQRVEQGDNLETDAALAAIPRKIGELVATGLSAVLELFDAWDREKARRIIHGYREIEDGFQTSLHTLMNRLLEDSGNIDKVIALTMALKSIERIGHHTRNLAQNLVVLNHDGS